MSGFLRYAVGLTIEEVCEVIKAKNRWGDYDPRITQQQVVSIRSVSKNELNVRNPQTSPKASVAGERPPFPCFRIPASAETVEDGDWIGIKSGCGYVLDWVRKGLIQKEVKE